MCVPELLRPPLLTLKSILHLYSRILNRLQLPELLHSVHHQHHLFCNHSLLPTYLLVLLFISYASGRDEIPALYGETPAA